MTASAGLALDSGDDRLLVARGTTQVSRGALKRASDNLVAFIKMNGITRALVQSDDPFHILRALDATARAGADIFIAHTTIPSSDIDNLCARFSIGLKIAERDAVLAAAQGETISDAHVHVMTSGTTGAPKVAAHGLSTLLARARLNANSPANRDGKWLLTYQPTTFAGLQVQLTAVMSGGVIVVPATRTAEGFYRAALEGGVTQISGTPTFWRALLMVAPPGALALRQITLGGEAADQMTIDRLKAAYPQARITHVYASTEAGVVFAVHDGCEGFPAAWLDRPNHGVELRINDGYLQIKTPNVMRGYATETEQPLVNGGWLTTADRCDIRGDRVFILGREDSVINVGGSKVYPPSIEALLLAIPGVVEARVYGVANPVTGQLVAADVVLEQNEDQGGVRARIGEICRTRLPPPQVPRILKFVDAIPVRASGKKG